MKKLGVILLVAVASVSSKAQQADTASVNKYSGMRVTNSDTIVIKKATVKPDGGKLADATPVMEPKPIKPVPLASDTKYFGSKSTYVAEYVQRYLKNHNKTLSVVQERSLKYFPIIDKILTEKNVPLELKYLAVIESALNNKARSRVGAVGAWQFMAATGRLMGLKITRGRDDRQDWVRSTQAAAKYLTLLYEDLDDWLLVVAAYNSGPRPVVRAIQRTGSTSFWDIKPYLPKETQNHVLAFVATATIFEDLSNYIGSADIPEELDFRAIRAQKLAASATENKAASPFTDDELKSMAIVRISSPISFDLLETELGIDNRTMRKWNYNMDAHDFSSEEYGLRLPKDKVEAFIIKRNSLMKRSQKVFSSQRM